MRDVRRPARKRPAEPRAVHPPKQAATNKSAQASPVVQPSKSRRELPGITGVDGATAERLRRGKVEPDAALDLHGLTQAEAHARLVSFVRRSHERGYRCLLVVTGKGTPPRDIESAHGFVMPERSRAGVLRAQVPVWLEHADTRSLVAGLHQAHQRHGGSGAFYVYLRRVRKAR